MGQPVGSQKLCRSAVPPYIISGELFKNTHTATEIERETLAGNRRRINKKNTHTHTHTQRESVVVGNRRMESSTDMGVIEEILLI